MGTNILPFFTGVGSEAIFVSGAVDAAAWTLPTAAAITHFSNRLGEEYFTDSKFLASVDGLRSSVEDARRSRWTALREFPDAVEAVGVLKKVYRAMKRDDQLRARIAGFWVGKGHQPARLRGYFGPLLGIIGPRGEGAKRFDDTEISLRSLIPNGEFLESEKIFEMGAAVLYAWDRENRRRTEEAAEKMEKAVHEGLKEIWEGLDAKTQGKVNEQLQGLREVVDDEKGTSDPLPKEKKPENGVRSRHEGVFLKGEPPSAEMLVMGVPLLWFLSALVDYQANNWKTFSDRLLTAAEMMMTGRNPLVKSNALAAPVIRREIRGKQNKQSDTEMALVAARWVWAAVRKAPPEEKRMSLMRGQQILSGDYPPLLLDAAANAVNLGELQKAEDMLNRYYP